MSACSSSFGTNAMKLDRKKALFLAAILAPLWIVGGAPQANAIPDVTDFNGDGYADLAIGVPAESINGMAEAGLVNIIYGSASGLSATATPDQRFFQDYSVPGDPASNIRDFSETGDRFGAAIAAGDFNDDGFSDIAIGVSGEDVGSTADAGAVNVVYGSASGLSPSSPLVNQLWTQSSPDVEDAAETGDALGSSLAAGDFNGDGYSDLAIGAPGESINGNPAAGSVNVLYGSASGLSATAVSDQRFFQDTAGIADFSEDDDHYGASLATGDFNGDGFYDLLAGVPGEDTPSVPDAGAISAIYGSGSGLSPDSPITDQLWTGSTPGISDNLPTTCPTPISGIGLPGALATGDFNGDGYGDMASGAATQFDSELGQDPPQCDYSFYGADGILVVVYGSASGLAITSSNDQVGRIDSIGDFARTLSAGDFNGDGYSDLVASFAVFGVVAPGDLTGGGLGEIQIYHGSAAGLPENSDGILLSDQVWSQGSGVPDEGERQDNFGYAITTGDFNNDGYADIAIGVSGEESRPPESSPYILNSDDTGAVNAIYGSSSGLSVAAIPAQLWTQDSPGIDDAGEIGDRFGTQLA